MKQPKDYIIEFEVDPRRAGNMRVCRNKEGQIVVTEYVTEKALNDAIVTIVKNKKEWNKSK